MAALKSWLSAFRLRTLPLSFSSILVGSFIAIGNGEWSGTVLTLALVTTLLLQILSNLANDLGDANKGTDNAQRLGPERAVQSGDISAGAMKTAVWVFGILSFLSGISLLYFGIPDLGKTAALFLLLGILAIGAALFYTLGKKPYGYMGLGDIFVFLFFGLLGVIGTNYLHTNQFETSLLLPAAAIGMLCAGVLNMNNVRDHENDAASGKRTLVVLIGTGAAKVYQTLLVLGAFTLLIMYSMEQDIGNIKFLYLIGAAPFFLHLIKVWTIKDFKQFDGQLKLVALSTFATSILFCIGQVL